MEPRNYSPYLTPTHNTLREKRHPAESAHRKLIRPSLTEYKEHQERMPQHEQRPHGGGFKKKRPVPPDQTNAENFYYVKQMQARTPMVVVLNDGEELHGVIEWYDRTCIKVNRLNGPNLLIYKANIKYLYKESEQDGAGGGNSDGN